MGWNGYSSVNNISTRLRLLQIISHISICYLATLLYCGWWFRFVYECESRYTSNTSTRSPFRVTKLNERQNLPFRNPTSQASLAFLQNDSVVPSHGRCNRSIEDHISLIETWFALQPMNRVRETTMGWGAPTVL